MAAQPGVASVSTATESDKAALLVHPEATPVSPRTALTYSTGNFGTGTYNAFNHYILPSFLSLLKAPPIIINLLSSTSPVERIVVQPLVGAWGDRGWHGRPKHPAVLPVTPYPVDTLGTLKKNQSMTSPGAIAQDRGTWQKG